MKKNASHREVSILLHNIRSVHNVGSIFRTADAFGVSKIYISGYTSAPTDRFGRARADISKVALGAEMTVPWEQVGKVNGGTNNDVETFIKKFKKSGGVIVALEQDGRSIDCGKLSDAVSASVSTSAKSFQKIILIPGNEVSGVEKKLLDMVDIIAEIPMRGKKESLNVSVVAGIALYELLKF